MLKELQCIFGISPPLVAIVKQGTLPLIKKECELTFCYLCLMQLIVVWDISHAIRGGEVSIIAKAHTDIDIQRMRIAEFDDSRY